MIRIPRWEEYVIKQNVHVDHLRNDLDERGYLDNGDIVLINGKIKQFWGRYDLVFSDRLPEEHFTW